MDVKQKGKFERRHRRILQSLVVRERRCTGRLPCSATRSIKNLKKKGLPRKVEEEGKRTVKGTRGNEKKSSKS